PEKTDPALDTPDKHTQCTTQNVAVNRALRVEVAERRLGDSNSRAVSSPQRLSDVSSTPTGSNLRNTHDRNFYFMGSKLAARVQKSLSPVIRVTRETHEAPFSIQERVERTGGTNCYGEANFRVVWGGSRLTWIGGRWTDRDASGNV